MYPRLLDLISRVDRGIAATFSYAVAATSRWDDMQRIEKLTTKLKQLFDEFIASEQASGIILMVCTVMSIFIANSFLGEDYLNFWQTKIGFDLGNAVHLRYSLVHWINDGLMTIFFLLIGLEMKREMYVGELSELKKVSLPIFAALGGMLMPALLYAAFNWGTTTRGGAGIPTATDIAFALGVLALLGRRVPVSLKVFLAALAIIDDLGAIVVIAVFYVGQFSLFSLMLALGIFAGLLVLNRQGVLWLPVYLVAGVFMWYFMLKSGVHPTVAGVLLAFAIPFGGGEGDFPSYRLQHLLHKPVAFLVMPLFAMANTGIVVTGNLVEGLSSPGSLGIFTGLFLGKPLGIVLSSMLAIKAGLSQLPTGVTWRHLIGMGFLGGIGFTMSMFITLLAFDDAQIIQSCKMSILLTSVLAGTAGYLILSRAKPPEQEERG
jgi:Na+:H+ antiporter, NhaA family